MDDEPGPQVEFLDEWDDDGRDEPPRRGGAGWLAGALALVVGLAVVVSLISGGSTSLNAIDPVNTSVPSAPPRPSQGASTQVLAPDETFTPVPQADDVEAVPLIITVADVDPPITADGLLTYQVSVCVSPEAGSITGGRVPVLRRFWTLVSGTSNELLAPITIGGPYPMFPSEWYYPKGQCAEGSISFTPTKGFVPQYLTYQDNRSKWSWRIS
ncbi:MAG: hypothetical protein ACOH16_01175 [Propionibacteriaceae bacterium]